MYGRNRGRDPQPKPEAQDKPTLREKTGSFFHNLLKDYPLSTKLVPIFTIAGGGAIAAGNNPVIAGVAGIIFSGFSIAADVRARRDNQRMVKFRTRIEQKQQGPQNQPRSNTQQ